MNLLQGIARRVSGILGRESWLIKRLRPAYESLLNVSGKGIRWEINGVTYQIDPHYRHRLGQDYDASVAAFLRKRVKPGAICLDVGANVGVYVLQFSHWSGPTGRVVAFEPNPAACEVLQRHIELNDLAERVAVVPAAVGAQSGQAIMYAAESDGMSRLGAPNELIAHFVKEISISVLTLDEYCKAEKLAPDWLLIDIEGFEIAALSGARGLIKSRGRNMGLIVEMHPDVWDSASTTRADAEDLLRELRLSVIPLTGQTDPMAEHGLVYLEHD